MGGCRPSNSSSPCGREHTPVATVGQPNFALNVLADLLGNNVRLRKGALRASAALVVRKSLHREFADTLLACPLAAIRV
jgi:hypothetical protein